MPIQGLGWEIQIRRLHEQRRDSDGKRRTIGTYQVFHNGTAVQEFDDGTAKTPLAGQTAEPLGPGSNAVDGSGVRIAPARYPLKTQLGNIYRTLGFTANENQTATPRPGIELGATGNRTEVLIHPGKGFLSSVGCINLAKSLPNENEPISFPGSRQRVIALINDMRRFLGAGFPDQDGNPIPNAWVVIEGDPPA